MNTNLTPKEWQTLSAYLDNQLNERDRRQLEARLQTNSDLREGLDNLRQTRALLRALPKHRAIRNFTLTPAMIPQKPRRSPFPVLRLASALASFLLVLAFLSDLAISSSVPMMMKASAPQAELYSAPQAESPAEPGAAQDTQTLKGAVQPTEVPFAMDDAPLYNEQGTPLAGGMGGGGGAEGEATTQNIPEESAAVTPGPTPDATEQARIAATLAPKGLGESGEAQPEATMGAALAMPAPEQTPQPTDEANSDGLRSFAPPAAENSQSDPDAQEYMAAPEEGLTSDQLMEKTFDPRSILRPAEIGLAVLAVLTGLLAWYFRGKS
jgi:hypothetical protein